MIATAAELRFDSNASLASGPTASIGVFISYRSSQSPVWWSAIMDGVIGSTGAAPAHQWQPPGADLTARERFLRMAERARELRANAPSYPDHPETIAEQDATTRALAESQARAMRKT